EDALTLAVLDELNAEVGLEMTHAARRLAVDEQRVVLQEAALAMLIEPERPRLERRDSARVGDIREQAVLVHLDAHAVLDERFARGVRPVAALHVRRAEHRRAVRPPRRRSRRAR